MLVGASELLLVGCTEELVSVLPGAALRLCAAGISALDEGRAGRIPEVIEPKAAEGCIEWYAEA